MHVSALQSDSGAFALLELDTVAKLAASIAVQLDEPSNQQTFQTIVSLLMEQLGSRATGVIIDPSYGLSAPTETQKKCQIALALDQQGSDEVDPLQLPSLIHNWGVPAIAQNYAPAKITLYYHPHEENALQEKQLIAELYDHCKHEGIDLLLKLMLYTEAEEVFDVQRFQEAQLQAITEFRASCDLMAIQYPQNALGCATVTTELDIPWVVVGDGQQYQDFKEIVRESLDAGAAGFLAGQTFWNEIGSMRGSDAVVDLERVSEFVSTKVQDRVVELTRIVSEAMEQD